MLCLTRSISRNRACATTEKTQRPLSPAENEVVKGLSVSILLVLLFVSVQALYAADETEFPDRRPLASWQSFDPDDYGDEWLTLDRNADGSIDYAVTVDDRGYKLREAMDFDHDGFMDNFYFYSNNVLQRQEIDTNADQQIDVWIYLRRGVYITMWERDRTHDGVIDERVVYGSEDD